MRALSAVPLHCLLPMQMSRLQPAAGVTAERIVEEASTPAKPSDYITRGKLRLVLPYYFDFKCHVKDRMRGKSIIDIFSSEFPARPREYYIQAFQDGRLRVQGRQVGPDEPLHHGDCIRHFIHRHEPPALAEDIQVLAETEDIVAVRKPGCMPVHVAGQYRKNTVLGVLQATRPDLQPLLATHRLDRPVSGLLLLARSTAAANRMRSMFEERTVRKEYLARVLGRVPASGPVLVDVPLAWDPTANHCYAVPVKEHAGTGTRSTASGSAVRAATTEAAPLARAAAGAVIAEAAEAEAAEAALAAALPAAAAEQAGAAAAAAAPPHWANLQAKPAATEFELLCVAPDGLTSVVACRPRTGRTHQIRVHLQHVGHPIANDVQYGGTYGVGRAIWQAGSGSGAAGIEQGRCKRARFNRSGRGGSDALAPQTAPGCSSSQGASDQQQQQQQQQQLLVPPELHDPLCLHCPSLPPRDYPLELEPLWLHCHSYSSSDWSFTCPPPAWAEPAYVPQTSAAQDL